MAIEHHARDLVLTAQLRRGGKAKPAVFSIDGFTCSAALVSESGPATTPGGAAPTRGL